MSNDEGTEPTEEVGPEECDAKKTSCEVLIGEVDDVADATHPSFLEEVADAYVPEGGLMVPSPEDGLPIPADESSEPLIAPPFTIDHVVCVEDEREWVSVLHEEVHGLYKPDSQLLQLINRVPAQHRGRLMLMGMFKYDGNLNKKLVFDPERVHSYFGISVVQLTKEEIFFNGLKDPQPGEPMSLMIVRPVRPRCVHYKRQVISNDGVPDPNEPGHRIIFRNCMARRSVGGAFLSLRDEAVYACDYRDPPDVKSAERYMDAPDRERLKSELHKIKLPMFRGG